MYHLVIILCRKLVCLEKLHDWHWLYRQEFVLGLVSSRVVVDFGWGTVTYSMCVYLITCKSYFVRQCSYYLGGSWGWCLVRVEFFTSIHKRSSFGGSVVSLGYVWFLHIYSLNLECVCGKDVCALLYNTTNVRLFHPITIKHSTFPTQDTQKPQNKQVPQHIESRKSLASQKILLR